MKVVINRCFGGFGISDEAKKDLHIDGEGKFPDGTYYWSEQTRTYQSLIDLIESKGAEYVNGDYSNLTVVEIPDDVDWYIDNYDGVETIEEVHRSWC